MQGEPGRLSGRSDTSNSDTALLKDCHRNYLAAVCAMASLLPKGLVEIYGGFTIIRTAMPIPLFNPVMALDPPGDFEGLGERIDRMFGPDRIPWSLVTTPAASAGLARLMEELGLKQADCLPGMIYDLSAPTTPPLSGDLDVRQVSEPDEIRTWSRTCEKGYGFQEGFLEPLTQGMISNPGTLKRVGLYLGYAGGQPVSTSMRVTTEGISGVYCVATVPEGRCHGYGAALTWRAGFDGRRDGCRTAYLQASAMGRPLYEKMGYKVVEEYQVWVPASPAEA